VVFEALTQPDRDPNRPWLILLDTEMRPEVLVAEESTLVVWSSLWPERPDARIHFELAGDGQGAGLRWTLYVDEPAPSDGLIGRLRYLLNELINANLRYTFGQ
jgi:hypothetical protein